jgi:hypothetical protein
VNAAETALVEALRSGRYTQTQGVLRDGDAFCCLGVACDISGLGRWRGMGASNSYGYVTAATNAEHTGILPIAVRDWLGWENTAPSIQVPDQPGRIKLDHLNDVGLTFEQIADLIEAGFVERAQ